MAEHPDLSATSWTVDEIAGAAVVDDAALTIEFDAEGGVSGHGGVNRFRAQYEQSGGTVEIGPIAGTKMAGPPPLMEQEHRFLAVLDAVDAVSGSDTVAVLTGTSDDGVEVTLRLVAGTGEPSDGAETPTGVHVLRGAVSYRERIPLPAGSTVTVTLEDRSLADAPAATIAETSFEPSGQVPVDFELQVPADALADTSRTFGLRARIDAEGELCWTTDTHHAVDHTTVDDRHDLWLVDARS